MTSPAPCGWNPMPLMLGRPRGDALCGAASARVACRCAAASAGAPAAEPAAGESAAGEETADALVADASVAEASGSSCGAWAGACPASETVGSEARLRASSAASASDSGEEAAAEASVRSGAPAAGAAARAGRRRRTRTSSRDPSACTSNSASPASSTTTRAVCAPAAAAPTRRMVPSSTSCSAGTPERAAAAIGARPAGAPPLRGSPAAPPRPRRILDQVADVGAHLAHVVSHGELQVAIVLDAAPEQVLAAGAAVDAARALRRGDLVQVAEDDRHRHPDVAEVRLVVEAGAVADHLVRADPARDLLDHVARLLVAALAQH